MARTEVNCCFEGVENWQLAPSSLAQIYEGKKTYIEFTFANCSFCNTAANYKIKLQSSLSKYSSWSSWEFYQHFSQIFGQTVNVSERCYHLFGVFYTQTNTQLPPKLQREQGETYFDLASPPSEVALTIFFALPESSRNNWHARIEQTMFQVRPLCSSKRLLYSWTTKRKRTWSLIWSLSLPRICVKANEWPSQFVAAKLHWRFSIYYNNLSEKSPAIGYKILHKRRAPNHSIN